MKHLILVLFLMVHIFAHGQKQAVTENGDQVVLYDNGTWKYVNADSSSKETARLNPTPFTKAKTSTFLLKSTKTDVGVWIDPKKWQIKKGVRNEDSEFEFTTKGKDLYGMLISEQIEIPIESLKTIALDNAKKAATDVTVVKEEYRTVNGIKVLLMQMNGTLSGIKFSYYGYYYSNPRGTVQLITYTSQSLLAEQLPNAEEFLNGLVTLNK